jgi:hypothetical protein
MANLRLRPKKIAATAAALAQRIRERIPGAGLADIADDLHDLARKASRTSEQLGQPIWHLRAAVLAACTLLAFGIAVAAWSFLVGFLPADLITGQIEDVQASVELLLGLGLVAVYLLNQERKTKRKRALNALYELREVAHVVDMHQLTKDPSLFAIGAGPTITSPDRALTLSETIRYLNYCTEMLAIVGKIAALYTQRFEDDVALAAAAEVEDLTTGLSSKIWQKIIIAKQLTD